MASIGKDSGGRKRILFQSPDGKRRTVRLGKCSMRDAESAKIRIERLLAARVTGSALDNDLIQWLATRPDCLYNKLAAVGLAEPRESVILKDYLAGYLELRSDVAPRTIKKYLSTIASLKKYFGEDRRIDTITAGDAREWELDLAKKRKPSTVGKHIAIAKVFFGHAVRKQLIPKNPFEELKSTAAPDQTRQYYVSHEEIEKIIDACPDVKRRLIIALGRYAGLRIPSELVGLKWSEVLWSENRFIIHAPKGENAGKGTRVCPIFKELRPYLDAAWEVAPENEDRIFPEITSSDQNHRYWLEDLIWSAGLEVWPKLFQNLRASAATDLCENFPDHVVNGWLGHTERIAQRHYRMSTEKHFSKAAGESEKSGTESGTVAAQNPAQHESTPFGMNEQETKQALGIKGLVMIPDDTSEMVNICTVAETGLEEMAKIPGTKGFFQKRGTESGTVSAPVAQIPMDIARLLQTWATLSDAERRKVMGVIQKPAKTR